jgi:OOP family OmpA-OmpF porin
MSSQPEGPEREYEQLKRLLLHQELARIEGLEQRLREPEHHAPLVGRDLPRAIRVSSAEGRKLSHALSPTVEGILHDSVRNDPRTMADALYPVMGPSIRRSIAEALSGMIQSFNEVLGNSFSWQGFKWRLEAMRTRKSFAEVVLLHSLVYRVRGPRIAPGGRAAAAAAQGARGGPGAGGPGQPAPGAGHGGPGSAGHHP